MKIEFTGRGFEVTNDLKEHTSSKMKLISKMLNSIQDVSVVLSTEKYRHRAEIKFLSHKQIFQGQEETADMLQSIDRVIDKLEKQARRFKEKRLKDKRGSGETIKSPVVSADFRDEIEDQEIKIIKTENYQVKPMSLEEAVEELSKLNQEFSVFRNADSNAITVVFKRNDGNFGYFEP